MSDVFAFTYGVELLCVSEPEIARPRLLESLERFCPGVKPLDPDAQSSLLGFVHPEHPVELVDAVLPAQTVVFTADQLRDGQRLTSSLRQAWDFPEARSVVSECKSSLLVTDMMSSTLEHRERLDLFQRALRGVLDCVPCRAIHWQASDRIVNASAWIESFDSGRPAHLFTSGAVNVRLFNIERRDQPGELLMDTLGLGALGLPDLQCHFFELDPSEVARQLYNVAWYVFSEGDVIEDGNTVEGLEPGSKWRCQHEDALVPPDRVVLDLDPGDPYAAGNRRR